MTRLTLADLDALILKHGAHDPDSTYCVMEAHAAMVGDKWTDSPPDVSPVIAAFMRSWNDSLPDDVSRTRLLVPILREGIMRDTAGGPALEDRRGWMAFDWLVREQATAWMDLTPALAPHAVALRGLPILSAESVALTRPVLIAARDAAGAAAGDAARAAAWDAAWDAARAAAGAAAWDAARAAARAAAWDAAWDAAGDAAWAAARAAVGDAAGDAAWAAVGDALAPTVIKLQVSARDLIRRMCAETDALAARGK